MFSGILLPRYVFRLDIHSSSAVLQAVHMLSAYWGFVFLSLHLGLHWRGMMGLAGKLTKTPSEFRKWALCGMATLIAGYYLAAGLRKNKNSSVPFRRFAGRFPGGRRFDRLRRDELGPGSL